VSTSHPPIGRRSAPGLIGTTRSEDRFCCLHDTECALLAELAPLEPVLEVSARVLGAGEFEGFAAEEGDCFYLADGLWRATVPVVAAEDVGDFAEERLVWARHLRLGAIWLLEEYRWVFASRHANGIRVPPGLWMACLLSPEWVATEGWFSQNPASKPNLDPIKPN
jgi:hypothetical protein